LSLCLHTFERSWQMRAARLALAAVLVVTVAQGASAQRMRASSSRRDVALYARLLAMTDSRTFDRPLVDSALATGWAPLRAAAALSVGQVGATHGIAGAPLLRDLLNDRDLTVASNAAYALGLLRDSSSVPALGAALKGPSRAAREAAWALGEIGAPARETLTGALGMPGSDESRTIQLLLAAAKLRPVPVADVRRYLATSNQPSVLWAATYAIARTRAAAGVRDLVTLATNPSFVQASAADKRVTLASATPQPLTADAYLVPSVGRQRARAEIARGLAKSAAGDSLGNQAFAVLTRLALDPHPHVRINAVRSLASYGSRAREAVEGATRDRDANVRIAAAQVLGTVLDSTVATWRPLWDADTSMMYRSSLLASGAHAGAMLPEFVTWQGHPDWHYRAATLSAASSATNSRLATQLGREMTADADARVREAAYSAIAGNDSIISPAAHDALVRGLSDPDFMVKATVLGSLGRNANAADARVVLDAYDRSGRDASNDARIAAIQYLATAWKRDSAAFPADLRARVGRLRPSNDPLVRSEAAHVSIFRGWESTSGTPRSPEWYQTIVRTYVLPVLAGNRQHAVIRTRRGDITLELFGSDAPITVDNFLTLARSGYYRGTRFHRVVPNFVVQDGDPRDDGNGGPGYAIRDEMNPRRYERGALGMALSGPDTGGSQYFITHSPQPHLDGHYTVFGRVVRGFGALDAIVQGDPILEVRAR
jgi:cyclophilin family peptidyl-prolyl cis-trans isomerase/HEAT repeat protein